jgi:acetylornithine deacetylase
VGSVAILERLIGFPTVSAASNLALIGYARDLLADAGVAVEVMPDATGRKAGLVARVGPAGDGGVMLSAHSDVVPAEAEAWDAPPFALTERDGRYFGRGTADMKGFVACALSALVAAAARPLTAPLALALSYDEEIGCVGVRAMLPALAAGPRPELVLVGEPTGMAVATGHKGKLAAVAECRGRAGHSALAPLSLNAIHLGCDLVAAVRAEQATLAARGARDEGFEVPYTTLHVGRFEAGTALNVVPDRARLELEIRDVPGDDPDAVLARLRAAAAAIAAAGRAAAPEAAVAIEVVNRYPGLATAAETEAVRLVQRLAGGAGTMKVPYGTEGGLFAAALGVPVVICGPGSMAQGHRADEYVTQDQLERCDALLAALVRRLEG